MSAAGKRKLWRPSAVESEEEDDIGDEPVATGGGSAPSREPRGAAVPEDLHAKPSGDSTAAATEVVETSPPAKEKAFAWMDSDDEDAADDAEEDGHESQEARKPQRSRSRSRSKSAERNGLSRFEASPNTTFSDFVRHSEDLVKRVAGFSAPELVELCKAAARVHYFDGDLVREIWAGLTKRIPAAEFDLEQVFTVLTALKDLNAYDSGVFHVGAEVAAPLVASMTKVQRLAWFDLYSAVRHRGDMTFLAQLQATSGSEEGGKFVATDGRLPCRHHIKGFCWMGKQCSFSHESGLTLPPHTTTTMLNGHQARQTDTYKPSGGVRAILR
mmetsp:Transcript_68846/g.165261  ORF Transcript_68846/g.165261 Transcript_68846/m.165261 type:complete len:328 (+) Transcript_68846:92-1075(+)